MEGWMGDVAFLAQNKNIQKKGLIENREGIIVQNTGSNIAF
jgi:hypothetical protein